MTPSRWTGPQEGFDGRRSSSGRDLSHTFLFGATLVVAGAALVCAFAPGAPAGGARADDIRSVLAGATALCGLAVFGLCRATWRQLGDRPVLWAGAAALLVATAAAARPELTGVVLGGLAPGDRWLTAVSDAATALAAVLFAAGLAPALQRRRFGPQALLAGVVGATVALTLLLHAAAGLGPVLRLSQLTGGGGAGSVAGGLVVVSVWLALAVGYTVRGLRRRWLYSWAGPLLFALTLSGLAAGAARPSNDWAVGAAVLEMLGVLAAVVGCHLELTSAYEDQTLRLSDSALDAETAEVRERVRAADVRVQRHDLINAITAIDGAAMILEREFDRLSAGDRATLARVLGSGTDRLRRLVRQGSGSGAHVSMAETAAVVAGDPAWRTGLHVDVTPDLMATGSAGETAEALHQLVEYAHRRALGSPVTLRGERDGEWVVLRVEDRGPAMSRELRRTLTESGAVHVAGREDAVNLRLAARLMRGQGGDLWVESRPGGGASFGICLPAVVADGDPRGVDA